MLVNKARTHSMIKTADQQEIHQVSKKVKNSEDSDTSSENAEENVDKLTRMSEAFKTIIEVKHLYSFHIPLLL